MSKKYSRHALDKMGGCVVNSTFGITDLKDTPNSYGKEGQYLIVNQNQNGFIYQGVVILLLLVPPSISMRH